MHSIAATSSEKHFAAQIDAWVLDAIRCGAAAFDDLVVALPGVYPTTALGALWRLVSTGTVSVAVLDAALEYVSQRPLGHNGRCNGHIALPLPHPLDHSWRFADRATILLLGTCLALTKPGDTIAFYGTPSLLRAAVETDYPRRVLLLERDAAVVDALRGAARPGDDIICQDIGRDPLPERAVSAVVLDPPWYEQDMQAFLCAASWLCRAGGHILLSLPPPGTRPGIAEERERLLGLASSLGLELLRVQSAALSYQSPLFERNALAAEGIQTIPHEWRHGDLAVFIRVKTRPSHVLSYQCLKQDNAWGEETAQGVRFRVHCAQARGFADPSLVPVVPGAILPSVSRRDPRRRTIDVWTSGNRVYHCQGGHILAHIVAAVATGDKVHERVQVLLGRLLDTTERALVSRAERQVRRIVDLECEEAMRFREE